MAASAHVDFAITQPGVFFSPSSSSSSKFHKPFSSSTLAPIPNSCALSLHSNQTLLGSGYRKLLLPKPRNFPVITSPNCYSRAWKVVGSAAKAEPEPLKVMISGAPASGKGTQCELITKKYDLVHIAAGDLLRAEVAAGSENGNRAKKYMDKGQLVPDEIAVKMVKDRLLQPDSLENGWLLDGYPRSSSQAAALQEFGFQPDIFILLEVPEEVLVERVVGRRLDPVTGKIYHLKYSPPETEEVAARLTQRFDDTEEKVKLRLQTHHKNVEAVLSTYEAITIKVNGNVSKEDVFAQIDTALAKLLEQKKASLGSLAS